MSDRLKVLVVDDDRMMVKTICDILTIKGYEPVAAYCGEEAVEKVKAGRPACVLMDLKMPGIDGVEALRVIREIDAELPVVLMSAYATEEKTAEAKRYGACALLSKPVDIQGVLSLLTRFRREPSEKHLI
jgi:two-component system NtrC family response regulator/two-component system nitrogen regulation response regulator GlnG